MRKLYLILIILTAFLSAKAQNTVTVPFGSASGVAKFRTTGTLTDSLNKRYFIIFDGGAYNELYTATYMRKYFLSIAAFNDSLAAHTAAFDRNFRVVADSIHIADTVKGGRSFLVGHNNFLVLSGTTGGYHTFTVETDTSYTAELSGAAWKAALGIGKLQTTLGVLRVSDGATAGLIIDTTGLTQFTSYISGVAPRLHAQYDQSDPLSLITRHTADSLVAAGGGGGLTDANSGLTNNAGVAQLGGPLLDDATITVGANNYVVSSLSPGVGTAGFQINDGFLQQFFQRPTSGGNVVNIRMEEVSSDASMFLGWSNGVTTASKNLVFTGSAVSGITVSDGSTHVGLNGDVVFPKSIGTQYAQYHKVDSIAKAKADSVKGTISGGVAWGAITGTLSSQTDLNTALGLKAPTSRNVSTGLGLSGGGNLSADRTIIADTTVLKSKAGFNTDYNNLVTSISGKQATLVSATNIKTINGSSLLGSGDLTVSGGTPGGSTTQLQFNNAGAFAGDANLYYDNTNKTIASGVTSVSRTADSVVIIGNSLAAGTGLPIPTSQRFFKLVADGLGYKEYNLGVPSATILTYGTSAIPTKTTHRSLLFVEFGYNDAAANDTATFHTNFTAFIASAISKGWLGTQIYILSINGVGFVSANDALYKRYNIVISQVATAKACNFIELYAAMQNPVYGGVSFLNQGTGSPHPNQVGAFITARLILAAVNSPNYNFTLTTPSAALKNIEATSIKIKNPLYYNNYHLAVIDSAGKIGLATTLPDSTLSSRHLFFGGSVIQNGAQLPTDFSAASDIVLTQTTGIIKSTGSGISRGGYIIPFQSDGNMVFGNNYRGANGGFQFWTAPSVQNTVVLAGGFTNDGRMFSKIGFDITQNMTIQSAQGSAGLVGKMTLFDNSGFTKYENLYSAGKHQWFTSNTVNNTSVQQMEMEANGHLLIQNGGTFTDDATNAFQVYGGTAHYRNNIATTLTDGLIVQNNNPSTSGVPNQYSPSLHFGARAWNTTAVAADNWADWIQYASVVSGATPTTTLTWASSRTTTSTPSYTTRMTLDNTGVLSGIATITATGTISGNGINGTSFIQSPVITNPNNNATLAIGGTRTFNAANTAINLNSGAVTNSSGQFNGASITIPYTQTSTAAATDLLINRTETSVGSGTQRYLSLQTAATENFGITNKGEVMMREGSNGFAGQTTLVSGTKAITVTGVTTASRAFVTLVSQGGTVSSTDKYIAVCTANTITISAVTNAGTNTVATADTSILNYEIIN